MSAILNTYSLTLAYGDPCQNNNPNLRYVDWKRSNQNQAVENPSSLPLTIPAGVETIVFDGTRTTAIDGTTAFSLSLSPLASDTYRFTATGGTAPAFRTDRGLNLTSVVLTLTAQANGSLLVAAAAGTPFSGLQVGDQVFIPGTTTGDTAGPFNALNEGLWTVLGTGGSGANVTLARIGDFQGIGQTVTPGAQSQFLGYSAAGVQPGDGLQVSAGFALPALKSYQVLTVTPSRVEVQSSTPLAAQTGILPTNAGMQFYGSAKRFVQIETDQEAVLRLNGDTGTLTRVQPWVAGDPTQVSEFKKIGLTWKLTILNVSAQALKALVISAE